VGFCPSMTFAADRRRGTAQRPFPTATAIALAGAAADRGVAEADRAAAAVVAALLAAFAAGLQTLAALFVAAGASDLAAVLRIFAVAMTTCEIALANGHTVVGAAATAATAGKHFAQVVQRRRGHFILATTGDRETTLALGELQLASRHHAPCAGRLGSLRRTAELPIPLMGWGGSMMSCRSFRQHCTRRHDQTPFVSRFRRSAAGKHARLAIDGSALQRLASKPANK
jgi:hypothetical protein